MDFKTVNYDFQDNVDGLLIKGHQEIDQGLLDGLKDKRLASHNQREGEFMHVAAIPVVVVEQWLREGFDVFTADGREIVKRLKQQGLEHFLATDKQI